jgi:hypothetical protein
MRLLKNKDVVVVLARRWFEKTNGNTYHSVKVSVNGDIIGVNNFKYGYDDQWEVTAREIIQTKYNLPNEEAGIYYSLYRLKTAGVKYQYDVMDVTTKKALKFI